MDKKKGVIIAVVLLLLLMVGTFAFQRDDEQKYDGDPDSGIQDDGQNGNDDNDPATTDPTTPTEEEGNTDDELDGTQTVNGGGNGGQNGNFVNTDPDNNQNGQGGNNDNGNVPSLELSTEKLEASVASGNDVLTTTNSVDTTLNELLSKLEKAVSEGEEIISNPTTQTAIDEKQEEIDNLLKQIQDYLDDAYAKAEAAVELSEKENTKENLDNATELVNLLPDGERKDALLDRIKDTTAPLITLNGDSPMTLEAGVDTYEELGATVTDNVDETVTDLQPVLINYSIGGVFNGPVENVDTTKVGTYKIVYKYTDQAGNVAVDANRADHDYVMRTVNVVDTTAGLLTLNGDSSMTLEAGIDTYEELGATVTDNVDVKIENLQPVLINYSVNGEFMGSVDHVDTTKVGTYKIVYKYTDQAGNVAVDANRADHDYVMRTVVVQDTTIPNLNPSYWTKTVEADKTKEFTDFPEVNPNDNASGDVKAELVNNTVDMSTPGEYKLQYVTTDANGNKAYNDIFITVVDTTKPVISIDRTVELNVGDKFVEDIYSKISDNSDDTLKVEIYPVNGVKVDTTTPGTYQISYKISDTSGNFEVATRTVYVK